MPVLLVLRATLFVSYCTAHTVRVRIAPRDNQREVGTERGFSSLSYLSDYMESIPHKQ